MASDKRCLYEILGLNRDCAPEEIRSAYRKLALQRHPDKLIKTGISEEEATAAFQELVNAYEVLSDPRERVWYDSHRSQILFADPKSKSSGSSSSIPDLFSFFSNSVFSGFGDTGKGFYKVYGDIFGKIYAQEVLFAKKLGLGLESVRDAPLMGNLESPYEQVSAFYGYWLGFCTIMDFCWVDEYEVMAGPNRKSRRMMEDENKKLRKKAKREYNDTVRGLAEFAKKRDKRVIDMQMKKSLEQEKKREEDKARKKEAERAKLEKARLYKEPDWAKIDGEEIENELEEEEEEDNDTKKQELYCVVCSKKFKSDKQWKNHEQSKKHREKVAEFRSTIDSEEEEEEEEEEIEEEQNLKDEEEVVAGEADASDVDELLEKFEDSVNFQEEPYDVKKPSSRNEGNTFSDNINEDSGNVSFGSDEEIGFPKARQKTKKNAASKRQAKLSSRKSPDNVEHEDIDLMEYNNRRTTRRNRAAKREVSKKSNEETVRAEVAEEVIKKSTEQAVRAEVVQVDDVSSNSNKDEGQGSEDNQPDSPHLQDSSPLMSEESGPNHKRDPLLKKNQKNPLLEKNQKVANQRSDKKDAGKRDTSTSTKTTSKRKKQRGEKKGSGLSCETCGEDFDTRNKLHKHLGDTGHASLKSRR